MKIKLNESTNCNDYTYLLPDVFKFNEQADGDDQLQQERYEKAIDILERYGYRDDMSTAYPVTINGKEGEYTIDDILDLASAKNGWDLVKYNDGSLGIIGRENNPRLDTYVKFID